MPAVRVQPDEESGLKLRGGGYRLVVVRVGSELCSDRSGETGVDHVTTITQIWMTLLLSNIFPSGHNSDLSLPKC